MKCLRLLNIFFVMKRRKRINIFWFFISFITSREARDTKHVIDGLYTARLKKRLCSERNARVVLAYGLHHISLFFCLKSLHESFLPNSDAET